MAKKRKKQKGKKKIASSGLFKKSLRQSTHPVPTEKTEEVGKNYDRKKAKGTLKEEIDRSLND